MDNKEEEEVETKYDDDRTNMVEAEDINKDKSEVADRVERVVHANCLVMKDTDVVTEEDKVKERYDECVDDVNEDAEKKRIDDLNG